MSSSTIYSVPWLSTLLMPDISRIFIDRMSEDRCTSLTRKSLAKERCSDEHDDPGAVWVRTMGNLAEVRMTRCYWLRRDERGLGLLPWTVVVVRYVSCAIEPSFHQAMVPGICGQCWAPYTVIVDSWFFHCQTKLRSFGRSSKG